MTIRDRDLGAISVLRRLKKANMEISAGVVGDKASEIYPDSDLSVGEVAAIHELGIGVPKRSFIRRPVDRSARKIQRKIHKEMIAVIKGKQPSAAAKDISDFIAEIMRDAVDKGVPPPLAPSTVAKKGHSWQLVDSGKLRAAIGSESEAGKRGR